MDVILFNIVLNLLKLLVKKEGLVNNNNGVVVGRMISGSLILSNENDNFGFTKYDYDTY